MRRKRWVADGKTESLERRCWIAGDAAGVLSSGRPVCAARSLLDLPQLYDQLETLLRRLGIPVRCEPFDPRLFGDLTVQGGMCRLHGASVVLIDSRAPMPDRVAVLAGVLAGFDLEAVYMAPQVRRFIECRGHQNVRTSPLATVIPIERARVARSRVTR